MTDVYKFLTDLEAKASAATSGPGQAGNDADFIAAANPEAVKRLVGMVRYLGKELELMQKSPRMNCYFGDILGKTYQQTEPTL